jgi:lipoprotein-anchoring transpeptidase ErfK/SrfK
MKNGLLQLFILFCTILFLPAYAAERISCDADGYHCVKVKRGQSWHSLFPDEHDRSIAMRINHRNGELWPGLMLAVPDDLTESSLLNYSPLPRTAIAQGEKMVVVDLSLHVWAAYDPDGVMVRWGPATGGRARCPNDEEKSCRTKEGTFRVYSLGTSNCVSSKFPEPEGGAPMPYCMFFNGGQALHGSPGGVMNANASHGCVRMFVQDAEWLRYDFVEPPMATNNYRGTKVVVLSSLEDPEARKEEGDSEHGDNESDGYY